MISKPIVETHHDVARNVVYIRYFGLVTASELGTFVAPLEELLGKMLPGFTLVSDLSGLDSMELGCAVHVTRIMDFCKKQGVAVVVRIVPDPAKDIGLNILTLTHYRGAVQVITCATLAEAERALAS